MSNQYPGHNPSDDDNSAPQTAGNQYGYGQQQPQHGAHNNPYTRPDPYEQQAYGGPGYQQYPAQRGPEPGKGMAITALVLGIVAIVLCLIPFIGFISIIGGLAAVGIGIIALKKGKPGRGMSIAGIVMGSVGAILAVLITIVSVMLIGASVESAAEKRTVEYSATSSGSQEN